MFELEIKVESCVPTNDTLSISELDNLKTIPRCKIIEPEITYDPYSMEAMDEFASMESNKLDGIIRKFFSPIMDKIKGKKGQKYMVVCGGSFEECIKDGKVPGPIYLYTVPSFKQLAQDMFVILSKTGEKSIELVSIEVTDDDNVVPGRPPMIEGALDKKRFKKEIKYVIKKVDGAKNPIMIMEAFSKEAKKEIL